MTAAYVRLDHPDRVAVAVFPHESAFIISLGNIPAADARAAAEWLRDEAKDWFEDVSQSGVRPGSLAGRCDVFVLVGGPQARVHSFVDERLNGGPNQIV
jgi:hypothetical protein